MPAAQRLARQLHPDEVDVVLVSRSDRFVERPRLHQLATGQELQDIPLRRHLQGTGIGLEVGRVTHLDRALRCLTLTGPDGDRRLGYDTLVYALGSTTDTESVPGVACHAHHLDGPHSAERLSAALRDLTSGGGTVVVCGGGPTGVETAAEIAESFPALEVGLVTAGSPGGRLSNRGHTYVTDTLERHGVSITEDVRIVEVAGDRLVLADGPDIPFDVCVWAGGFTVPTLARDSGLEVDRTGRIRTDRYLRAVSDPHVWALGDAAAVPGPWGDDLAMGCRTGGFTAPAGADNVAAALTGERLREFRYRYFHECISLGRRRGLVQFLHADGSPTDVVLTGRLALRYKEATLRSVVVLLHRPGPHLRHRRLAVASGARQAVVSAERRRHRRDLEPVVAVRRLGEPRCGHRGGPGG